MLQALSRHVPGGFSRGLQTIRTPRPPSARNPMWISRKEIETQSTQPVTPPTPQRPPPKDYVMLKDIPPQQHNRYLQQRAFGEGDPHGYGYKHGMHAALCLRTAGRNNQGWPGSNAFPWVRPRPGHNRHAPGPPSPELR